MLSNDRTLGGYGVDLETFATLNQTFILLFSKMKKVELVKRLFTNEEIVAIDNRNRELEEENRKLKEILNRIKELYEDEEEAELLNYLDELD